MSAKKETTNWKQVKDCINKHNENSLEIGQELTDADGTIYQVANINTERHEVIFIRKYILPDMYAMNFCESNSGGWKESSLRKYLNMKVILGLSDELRSVITPRTYMVSKGGKKEELDEITDILFLPREGDMLSERNLAAKSEYDEGNATQWTLCKKTKERIKTFRDDYGDAYYYWLSSPVVSSSITFCLMSGAGFVSHINAICEGGIVPCFMIAAEDV